MNREFGINQITSNHKEHQEF